MQVTSGGISEKKLFRCEEEERRRFKALKNAIVSGKDLPSPFLIMNALKRAPVIIPVLSGVNTHSLNFCIH